MMCEKIPNRTMRSSGYSLAFTRTFARRMGAQPRVVPRHNTRLQLADPCATPFRGRLTLGVLLALIGALLASVWPRPQGAPRP